MKKVKSKIELNFMSYAECASESIFNEFSRKYAFKFKDQFWAGEGLGKKLGCTAIHKNSINKCSREA